MLKYKMETREDKQKDMIIQVVTRQTSLTYDEAKEKLEEEKYNYMKVIKEWNGIQSKEDSKTPKTVNQEIYKQIRGLMDDSCKNYRMKKEYEEKKKVFIERLNKEHQERLRKQKETDKDHQENKEGKEQGEEKKLETINED